MRQIPKCESCYLRCITSHARTLRGERTPWSADSATQVQIGCIDLAPLFCPATYSAVAKASCVLRPYANVLRLKASPGTWMHSYGVGPCESLRETSANTILDVPARSLKPGSEKRSPDGRHIRAETQEGVYEPRHPGANAWTIVGSPWPQITTTTNSHNRQYSLI